MSNANFHMEFIKVNTEREGMKLYDIKKESAFRIYGVFHDGERYRRIPADVAEATSPAVAGLCKNTAGGRVRFMTDSPYVFIKVVYENAHVMTHMPLTGSSGFDMYQYAYGKETFDSTFRPPQPEQTVGGYEAIREWGTKRMRTLNINFPLYNSVNEVYIGIEENSALEPAPDYKYEKPIVYYGSSITQGGCSSRPGTCYQGFVTRHFDTNYINLGFSGSAKGEDAIADYIAGLDMSVFVYDYDHNAPSTEHLRDTHEKMFKKIRAKHPDLPVIMMSRPKLLKNAAENDRNEIIKTTFANAVSAGDRNVYFIDGESVFRCDYEDCCTVDSVHPNDYGFLRAAENIEGVFHRIINDGKMK